MKINNETKLGVFVVFVIALLTVFTIKTGVFNFSKEGYMIKVHFRNIDGINVNTPVRLNGFEVGVVKSVNVLDEIEETIMELNVWINGTVKLRTGSNAFVKNLGFLGEKYVALSSAGKGKGYLPEGAIIVGKEPVDMDSLLQDGQEIVTQIKELATNINERLAVNKERIDNILANFDVSMVKLASITTNVDERLELNKDHIDSTLKNLNSSSVNLDQFTYDLKQNPWKLMYRPKEKRLKNLQK